MVHIAEDVGEPDGVGGEGGVPFAGQPRHPLRDPCHGIGERVGKQFGHRLPCLCGGHRVEIPVADEFICDDVAFAQLAPCFSEQRRCGDVADVHGRLADINRDLGFAARRFPQIAIMRGRLVIVWAVSVGDAERDAGQALLAAGGEKTGLRLHSRADIGRRAVHPVERNILRHRAVRVEPKRAHGTGEDEAFDSARQRGINGILQPFDIVADDRRLVGQPESWINDAVKDGTAALHRGAQRGGIEHVAMNNLDVQPRQRLDLARWAQHDADAAASLDQETCDVTADKAAGPGHQNGLVRRPHAGGGVMSISRRVSLLLAIRHMPSCLA